MSDLHKNAIDFLVVLFLYAQYVGNIRYKELVIWQMLSQLDTDSTPSSPP